MLMVWICRVVMIFGAMRREMIPSLRVRSLQVIPFVSKSFAALVCVLINIVFPNQRRANTCFDYNWIVATRVAQFITSLFSEHVPWGLVDEFIHVLRDVTSSQAQSDVVGIQLERRNHGIEQRE